MATKRKTAKPKAVKAAATTELPAEHRAGYEANAANANVETCPFPLGSAKRAKWCEGWYAAEAARHDSRTSRKVRR